MLTKAKLSDSSLGPCTLSKYLEETGLVELLDDDGSEEALDDQG